MQLSERLLQAQPLLVPGASDALTASIVADVGFEAVYLSGAGITNRYLGAPDLALITLTELAGHVDAVRDAVDISLIVDADTGFGGPLNVRRTVRMLERCGANAIQIEDQVDPKRCGHFEGKEVVPAPEMVAKIRAAVDARASEDTLIIGRTDARQTHGLDEAIERVGRYRDAGADIVFVEAPLTVAELEAVGRQVDGPKLVNMVEGGDTPLLPLDELGQLGFTIVLYANTALRAAMKAMHDVLSHLRRTGSTADVTDALVTWDERQRMVGKPGFDELGRRYTTESGSVPLGGGG
jgi:2-methylisocitrate lyase-like PEP mutase family enzyme